MVAPAQWIVAIVSYAVLFILLWRGRRPDRWAAFALIAAQTIAPAVAHIEIGGVRVGVAASSFCLSVILMGLAIVGRRWWLVLAAGVQLVAVASWIYQFLETDAQIWAAVTFRIILWTEITALALFGVFEARYAPYAKPERRRRS